jgi:SnoaL-like domain
VSVVDGYLERLVAHDWDGLAACLAVDVERVGPFGDTYRGRESYVDFLADLMPKLPGYSMRVERVVEMGRIVVSELAETVVVDGAAIVTPESLVFDLDDDGLIGHISVYIQRIDEPPLTLPGA